MYSKSVFLFRLQCEYKFIVENFTLQYNDKVLTVRIRLAIFCFSNEFIIIKECFLSIDKKFRSVDRLTEFPALYDRLLGTLSC